MQSVENVHNRVRTLREHVGMKQADFGAAVGVSRGHIAMIETGRDLPGRELLLKIAKEFNISLDWLSRGHGDMRPARALNEREALLLYAYRHMAPDEAEAHLEYMLKRARASETAEPAVNNT